MSLTGYTAPESLGVAEAHAAQVLSAVLDAIKSGKKKVI